MTAPFPDRVPCRVCGHTAYDLSEIAPHPCAHDLPLCEDCRLLESADGGCLDCRLDVERDMYATGVYDPGGDPFYRPERKAADDQPRHLTGFDPATNSYTYRRKP